MKEDNMSKAERINAILMIIKKQNKLLTDVDYKHLIDNDIKKLYRIFYRLDSAVDQIFNYYKDCPQHKYLFNKNGLSATNVISNFKLEWEVITPYTILEIEEKEYTKAELLKIISKRIKFIQDCRINIEETKNDIDQILDAYNELTKKTKKKR